MSSVCVRIRIGSEHYAVPVEAVLEVCKLEHVTPMPGAPRAVLGVRNLRGQVLPVIDLGQVLGIGAEGTRWLVVGEHAGHRAGLTAAELEDVAPMPGISEQPDSPYLQGVTWVDGVRVGILDVASVLGSVATEDSGR